MTNLKSRINEAMEVAKSLAGDYVNSTTVDTIVCMAGTEIHSVFTGDDVPGYQAFSRQECPFCKKACGLKLW